MRFFFGLMLVCLLLATAGDVARVLLRLDRLEALSGQWWRLLTAHLVHLGWSHTLMNLIALLLLGALFSERYSNIRWLFLCTVSALAISAALLFFMPELGWYVGLSGVLHGVFAAGVLAQWRVSRLESGLLGAGLVAKLIWEILAGPLPGSASAAGGAVVVEAHLYGAVSGAVVAAIFEVWRLRSRRSTI